MGNFRYLISENISVSNFTTIGLFDGTFVHSRKSAIDDFIEKRSALFALLNPYGGNIDNVPNELKNMILLGCISAVESYIRKIIRTIINVDSHSMNKCEEETLTFGAVLYHSDADMLPEALLEDYSFTNGYNIKETIKKFIGVDLNRNQDVNTVLLEYSKICHLRHCVVHRFGLLGSKNAIKLGISEHKDYLEKPLQISFDNLNEMVQICGNVVKVINNNLFCEVLERTFKNNIELWYFDYRKDKKTFKKYYDIFKDSTSQVDDKTVYKLFIKSMQDCYGREFQLRGSS